MESIRNIDNCIGLIITKDGFYTNAFMRTDTQRLKQSILKDNLDVLDKIPFNGLNKILKEANGGTILVANMGCNLDNGITLVEHLINNNIPYENIIAVSTHNMLKNEYNTCRETIKNNKIPTLKNVEKLRKKYIEDNASVELLNLLYRNICTFRKHLDIDKYNEEFRTNKNININNLLQEFKLGTKHLLEDYNFSNEVIEQVMKCKTHREMKQIIDKEYSSLVNEDKNKFIRIFKKGYSTMNVNFMHKDENLLFSINLDDKNIESHDYINSTFDTYGIEYYKIKLDQLIVSLNSNVSDTVYQIAQLLNPKYSYKDVIQDELSKNKIINRISAYMRLYRKEFENESYKEAFKEYKYKLLCIFKSLNEYGILVEEISKLLSMNFLVPKNISKETALKLIVELFKQYGIYDTIWRLHILPINEHRRVFTDYTDEKTIYLKEIV